MYIMLIVVVEKIRHLHILRSYFESAFKMPIRNIFSNRKAAAERAGALDVYNYNDVPTKLRGQIVHILRDSIGIPPEFDSHDIDGFWGLVHDSLCREYGQDHLASGYRNIERCIDWFTKIANADQALDFVEVSFDIVLAINEAVKAHRIDPLKSIGIKMTYQAAVDELNERFRQNGIGFQFVHPHIIRIDNQFIHAEAVLPALALLSNSLFKKSNEDFRDAHSAYREGRYKDCVVATQRAFESTLKAICTDRGWKFEKSDRAPELVKAARENHLFPEYLSKGFDTYIAMIKTGLPEVRNNAGGHGVSPNTPEVPGYIAAYAIHLTAANIVLLGDAFKKLPPKK
jgi:hypothetical protein